MAALPPYISYLCTSSPFPIQPHLHNLMSYFPFLLSFVALSLLSLLYLSFSFYKRRNRIIEQPEGLQDTHNPEKETQPKYSDLSSLLEKTHQPNEADTAQYLTHSLLLQVLPPDSPKWASLFCEESCDDSNSNGSGPEKDLDLSVEEQKGKKKRRRRRRAKKKKSTNFLAEEESYGETRNWGSMSSLKEETLCACPFTSSSSAMQRKIKQQYDELVKCHESRKLTLAQVSQFANSLIEARNELQHKADVIQRKFTITKALLFKANRSSFDRLHQQIHKLELEQKRLEKDAFVYNWLQQHLKLSPAFKKMLEVGTRMELEARSVDEVEDMDADFTDISFEELLAQEKKDSFWQKNGKSRVCSR